MSTVGEILDLEPVGDHAFLGRSPAERQGTVFGGQLVSQALMAALATVDDGRVAHSLHAYYLRAGDPGEPLRYVVEVVRDGRSFASREVVCWQKGKEVLRAMVSLQAPADGPSLDVRVEHDALVSDPSGLSSYGEWLRATSTNPDHHAIENPGPIEMRLADPPDVRPGEAVTDRLSLDVWMRLSGSLPEDPRLHAGAIVWLSDKAIADHITLPHGHRWTDHDADSISLDHAVWLHRPCRVDGWLLYRQSIVATGSMRGLARGEIYTAGGSHVATVAQEALMRLPG